MTYIQHIETFVPEKSYTQTEIAGFMKDWIPDRKAHRYIDGIYRESGIDKRHTVITNLNDNHGTGFFKENGDGVLHCPSTRERNDLFAKACSHMAVSVTEKAVRNCLGISVQDITHLITVSCTGFYNPGPDLAIIQQLGLPHTVQRYALGFMGCYAAIPALRMSRQFCEAQPDAVVLIVCIELCTLHLQLKGDQDSIIANSIFADGAAAVVVTSRALPASRNYRIRSFSSSLFPEGIDDMTWRIGDSGFDMVLTKYVPRIIGANISELIGGILSQHSLTFDDIGTWAVHPGGKSILDKIERGLGLSVSQLQASRDVLRHFGNMSSVTILFVLKEILERKTVASEESVFAIAFGPGLTVESALLTLETKVA